MMRRHSPYNYAFNNPVYFIDPDGMSPIPGALKSGLLVQDTNFLGVSDISNGNMGSTAIGESIAPEQNNTAAYKDYFQQVSDYAANADESLDGGGCPEPCPWGTITERPTTWVDKWEESTNIFAQTTYSIANSFSIVFQSLNPFDNQVATLSGEGLNGTDRSEYGADVAATLIPIGSAKVAAGPIKQWIRSGPSYSKELGQSVSHSIRWGASPARNGKYLEEIPSSTFRNINQWLRNQKLPGNSWRVKDSGHFHIKK